jgi:hypothetical protein
MRSTNLTERNERPKASTCSTDECEMGSADQRAEALAPSTEDSPIAAFVDRLLAARWRRMAHAQGAECIEVVHAATGSRFLLSRENGVWLLTIQSRARVEDDEALVQALRDLFTRRGLGQLDVIKG